MTTLEEECREWLEYHRSGNNHPDSHVKALATFVRQKQEEAVLDAFGANGDKFTLVELEAYAKKKQKEAVWHYENFLKSIVGESIQSKEGSIPKWIVDMAKQLLKEKQ